MINKNSSFISTWLYYSLNIVSETSSCYTLPYFNSTLYYLKSCIFCSMWPQTCSIDLWVRFLCSMYTVICFSKIVHNPSIFSMILSIFFMEIGYFLWVYINLLENIKTRFYSWNKKTPSWYPLALVCTPNNICELPVNYQAIIWLWITYPQLRRTKKITLLRGI